MRRHTILYATFLGLFLSTSIACGPSCPKVKSAMNDKQLANDDASRVNEFVERRKTLMDQARGGDVDPFTLQRIKFSVTAYELAIQIQVRIIELAASSDMYKTNIDEINATRCLLDDVLKERLINKEDVTVSDTTGREIQERHVLFKQIFGKEGEASKYDLEQYYKSGIKLKKEATEKKDEGDEEGIDEEGGGEEGGDEEGSGEEGIDEEGGNEEEGMDSESEEGEGEDDLLDL